MIDRGCVDSSLWAGTAQCDPDEIAPLPNRQGCVYCLVYVGPVAACSKNN